MPIEKRRKLFIPRDEPLNVLGVDIQNGEITPETSKIEDFNALPSPQTFQELGRILGSFTWLSANIPASQELAAPLHQLLHGERWLWTDTHESALQEMKKLVLSRKVRRSMPLVGFFGKGVCLCRCLISRLRRYDCGWR